MKELMMTLFIACVQETIPNRYTIDNLTEEQKHVIYDYTSNKCNNRVAVYFNLGKDQEGQEKMDSSTMGEQPI